MDEIDGNFDDSGHDEVEGDSDCYHYHTLVDNCDNYYYSLNNNIQVMIIKRMARMMVLRMMMELGDDGVFTPLPLALVLPSLPPPS